MFYYRYEVTSNGIYKLTGEKSTKKLNGEKVVFCEEEIDTNLFDVTIGYINDDGMMLRYSFKIRDPEVIVQKIKELEATVSKLTAELNKYKGVSIQ